MLGEKERDTYGKINKRIKIFFLFFFYKYNNNNNNNYYYYYYNNYIQYTGKY